MSVKQCFRCKETKPLEQFSINKGKPKTYCKPCSSAKSRQYLAKRRVTKPDHYEINRERQRRARETNKKMRVSMIFNNVKFHAKRRSRDLDFSLTSELLFLLFELQEWKCKQTGIPFDLTTGKGKRPFGPAVDRIKNEKGYSISNIQLVCNIYNYAKNEFTDDDVMMFANALIENKLGS
jgi:hypothetical protein